MSTITLKLSKEELNIFRAYAKLKNKSLSETIRSIVLEHIEDEYDMQVFAEYEKEKSEKGLKTRPIEELWEEVGI